MATEQLSIRTHSLPDCYLCNSKGDDLYQNLTDHLFGAPGVWNHKKCSNPQCELVWLDPMPEIEDIGKLYQEYYTHSEISPSAKVSLFSIIKSLYSLLKIFISLIPGTNRQRLLCDQVYLEGIKPGKLLDVGCGNGNFLKTMQDKGWEVRGTDFDTQAINFAKEKYGVTVDLGDLRNINYPENSFDAITLNNVIEHLPNPVDVLEECKRILKPNGHLVVVTPNIQAWGHQKFKSDWRGLEVPRHLFLFSNQTLKSAAIKAKIEKYQVFSTLGGVQGCKQILEASRYLQKLNQNQNTRSLLPDAKISLLLMVVWEFILLKFNSAVGEWTVLLATK